MFCAGLIACVYFFLFNWHGLVSSLVFFEMDNLLNVCLGTEDEHPIKVVNFSRLPFCYYTTFSNEAGLSCLDLSENLVCNHKLSMHFIS